MRISDWSSDVCSSDLPAPPSEKSPLGVRPREAADTAALTRDCSDCTAAPSDAVLAATEFAAACSAVFLNCSAAAALAAADAVSPYVSTRPSTPASAAPSDLITSAEPTPPPLTLSADLPTQVERSPGGPT